MKHIALIHGHSIEFFNEWHHVGFWKRSFDEMKDSIELHLYTWDNWKTMPEGYDLYLFLDYRPSLWEVERYNYHPRALFWWDCFHHLQSVSIQLALVFDRVYVAERIESNYIRTIGYSNVEWLPGSYYPGIYHPIEGSSKVHSFGFIGQFDDTVIRKGLTRKGLLDQLCSKYGGFLTNNCRGVYTNQIYNESKIMPERTIFANIGTRLFEVVGSGGFCLMNRYPCNNGLDELGVDGLHFVTYDESSDDFFNKFEYYLKNDKERQTIAKSGQKYFLEKHTYKHRIQKILKDFNLE
jgi:hypothetical protein